MLSFVFLQTITHIPPQRLTTSFPRLTWDYFLFLVPRKEPWEVVSLEASLEAIKRWALSSDFFLPIEALVDRRLEVTSRWNHLSFALVPTFTSNGQPGLEAASMLEKVRQRERIYKVVVLWLEESFEESSHQTRRTPAQLCILSDSSRGISWTVAHRLAHYFLASLSFQQTPIKK